MAKWQITQTQQVGNTTINTWQNVPSLADIMAEARREEAKRLTQRAVDVCPACDGEGYRLLSWTKISGCLACNGTGKRN